MAQGMMSRTEMEATINRGWSVIHNGVLHSTLGTLPTEEALAAGDPAAEAQVKADLQRQIDELNARLASVQGGQPQGDAAEQQPPTPSPGDARMKRLRELNRMNRDALAALAEGKGVSTDGSRNDLAANILDAEFPEE